MEDCVERGRAGNVPGVLKCCEEGKSAQTRRKIELELRTLGGSAA